MVALCAALGIGQAIARPASRAVTVPAVLLSDLHFDPFHDPAKTAQLLKAPVARWDAILAGPDSSSQAADFAAVQDACKSKLQMDSPYALLAGGLQQARASAGRPAFVEVSGDLLVHDFDCRYQASLKLEKATREDMPASAGFAAKTTVFVMKKVEAAFAGAPVYFALGNNDSGCDHDRLDRHDAYLDATGLALVGGLRGVSATERKQALKTYKSAGYYAVTMPAPMARTRLLVIDDIYMMSKYANCEADQNDKAGADEQLAWLKRELDDARQRGERVWLLGHVPPTVNPASSLKKERNLCASGDAVAYLATNDLSDLLEKNADIVKLAIFGHTHLDEMHVLGPKGAGVPVKVVGSVSPASGNKSSVTVGKVAPAAAVLMDYAVFVASNDTGVGATWTKEYSFGETYHETGFTAPALADLIGRLHADHAGTGGENQAYQSHYYNGAPVTMPGTQWAGYVCSLDHSTAKGFSACVCGN
jgi:sphingomyelin phosphodiesterase acid-like 3